MEIVRTAGGLLVVACVAGCAGDGSAPPPSTEAGCFALADGTCVKETFKNPPELAADANGVHHLELRPTEFMVGDQRHCGRAYNGMFPAPTLVTRAAAPGEKRQVRIDLRNRFTRSDYQTIGSKPCSCTDATTGTSCIPEGGHAGHQRCACTTSDGEECHVFDFNVTNLHAHGSHVRPDYATGKGCVEENGLSCRTCSADRNTGPRECFFADDVIARVEPGNGIQVRWDIDEDGTHHEGLDWYHPHIHGSTAIQVAAGATGAWIIRGPVDEVAGVKDAKERVFVLSTPPTGYTPLPDGVACDEDHLTFDSFGILGDTAEKQANLINGIRRPRLVMPPGQIERWRFLHGAFLDEVYLALVKAKDSDCRSLRLDEPPIRLTQISRDGITLPKPAGGADWPFSPPYLFMSPGYRIDAMLDGSTLADGETLCLMAARFLQDDTTGRTDEAVGQMTAPTADDILRALTNGDLVAIVNVTRSAGTPTETRMPDLAAVAELAPSMMLKGGTVDALARCQQARAVTRAEDIDQLAALWTIVSEQEGLDFCACSDHNVNCKNFERTVRSAYPYDRVLKKGEVEHWRVVSGFDGHPFHIHVNPFVVCPLPSAPSDRNTKGRIFEPPFAHWRDTYLVNLDRVVDLVTEYRAFTGSYVFHCHKLTHEDHGMMELIRVCDPATESCDTLCSGGPCGWDRCMANDTSCERARQGAMCMVDAAKCPEALLRCAPCTGARNMCPANAHCAATEDVDDVRRCIPGCVTDDHCGPTERCDNGTCRMAAPCGAACPPNRCVHGACT